MSTQQRERGRERGLDAITEEEWDAIREMGEEYPGQFGDDLQALYAAYEAGEIGSDGDDE
jgi:hypothetical protein